MQPWKGEFETTSEIPTITANLAEYEFIPSFLEFIIPFAFPTRASKVSGNCMNQRYELRKPNKINFSFLKS